MSKPRTRIPHIVLAGVAVAALFLPSCSQVDESRLPSLPVSLNLGDPGVWHAYGVSSFGQERRFVFGGGERIPTGFPYTDRDATGFGGVLLTQGIDPFSGGETGPLAYDLSCPVEGRRDIKVGIRGEGFDAVCPVCGSRFDVVTGAGAPVSGPAAENPRVGLRRYVCQPTASGGYIITN